MSTTPLANSLLILLHYREDAETPSEKEVTAGNVTDDSFMVTMRSNRAETKEKQSKKGRDRFPFMRQVEVEQGERSKARLERERIAQNFRKYVTIRKYPELT